jgi:hypothetical protein
MNTIIEILIDKSGSMGYMKDSPKSENKYLLADGSTRTDLLKKMMLQEILPLLDYSQKIIIRTFRRDVEKSENEIRTIYENGYDKEELTTIIKNIPNPPMGGTPISTALETSIEALTQFKNYDRKIILLTDGQENGAGNYFETAQKAMKLHGIPCKIFIVGINQDVSARKKSKDLAASTKGMYLNVNTINYDKREINESLLPLKKEIIQSSINNLTTLNSNRVTANNPNKAQNTNIINTNTSFVKSKTIPNVELINQKNTKADKPYKNETITTTDTNNELKEVVDKNSKALQLISKQLENLGQEISNLKVNIDDYENHIDLVINENQELNKKIGRMSEQFLFEKLRKKYGERLVWLNKNEESFQDHDFEVIDDDKSVEYFIECKGTKGNEKFFYLTKNEWELFIKNTKNYQVYFVHDILIEPKIIKIDNLLDWILKGKIYPLSDKNRNVKANRIMMTIN